jgi:hypothetical protein
VSFARVGQGLVIIHDHKKTRILGEDSGCS